VEQTHYREIVGDIAIMRREEGCMRRIALIGCALLLAMTASASARMGIAPLAAQDDAVIQVKHGHGHGHHMGRGGRGHHYGWGRGRGHHKGWRHHRHH
jgi:hypothetical protein